MLRFPFRDRRSLVYRMALSAGLIASTVVALAQDNPPTAAAPAAAPQSPSTTAGPVSAPGSKLSVTTHEVLLDVVVTDSAHHPVTGLIAADFTLTEEGSSQTLKHVREHQPMAAEEVAKMHSTPPLPPNTFTNYTPALNTNASTVILLDALNSSVTAQMYLREELIKYLKTMPPGASIAIFQMDTQMRLIQGFTSDRAVIEAAAEGKRDWPSMGGAFYHGSWTQVRMRRIILREGLLAMARYLAGFPGRKNLIWFTGELPIDRYSSVGLEAGFGAGLGNPFRDGFRISESGNDDDDLDVNDILTLSRVAVYPVDARGLEVDPAFEAASGGMGRRGGFRFISRQFDDHAVMNQIADSTGGKAYYNTNGLSETIAEVVNNGSSYYSLAYSTTNTDWHGQFRKIKVTVNRPGVTLLHRHGYYAVNREQQEQRALVAIKKRKAEVEAAKAQAPEIGDTVEPAAPEEAAEPADTGAVIQHRQGGFAGAMALGAVAPTELVMVAKVSPEDKVEKMDKKAPPPPGNFLEADYRGKPFRTYEIVIRADARGFKLTKTADGLRHGRVEYATVVYDASGKKVNSVLSTATIDMQDATYRAMLKAGAQVKQSVAIPVKGNYFIRLGVHDFGGDQIGALEIPVDQVKLAAVAH